MLEQITTSKAVQQVAAVAVQDKSASLPPVKNLSDQMSKGKQDWNEAPPESRFEQLLREKLAMTNQSVNISVDESTKRIVVKIIDNETSEVIRQLPSEEMLKISRSLAESSVNRGNVTDVRI